MINRKTVILEGPQDELEIIQALFESGELSKLPGIKILDIEMVPAEQVEADQAISVAPQSLIKSVELDFTKIWLENILKKGFQPIVRSTQSATSIKQIQFNNKSVELLIKIVRLTEKEIQIFLKVRPSEGKGYLPEGLKVNIFDEVGEILPEKYAHNQTNLLDVTQGGDFICQLEDHFSVRLTFGNETVREDFPK